MREYTTHWLNKYIKYFYQCPLQQCTRNTFKRVRRAARSAIVDMMQAKFYVTEYRQNKLH